MSEKITMDVRFHVTKKQVAESMSVAIDMDASRLRVNGGFFWFQDQPGIEVPSEVIECLKKHGLEGAVISNNVIFGRPKWWQLRRWWTALKAWLSLPSATYHK